MKKGKLMGIIVTASLVVGTNAAFAQQSQPRGQEQPGGQAGQIQQDTQTQPASPKIDEPAGAAAKELDAEKFIKESAKGNVAELQIAQLATQKAQDPEVKQFAEKLVADHSKLQAELKQIAEKKGVTLPTEVDSKKQEMIDHLSGLSGEEFDKAFAEHMVKHHQKDIAKFKKAAESGDAEVRDLAQNTLPTLQGHLKTAQKWAPEATAGGAIDEPAGAQPDKKDDPDARQQDQSEKQEQEQKQSPDAATP